MSRTETSVCVHGGPAETGRRSESVPRMYEAACGKEPSMAVHGLQCMERRASLPCRARAAAMRFFPCLQRMRKREGVRVAAFRRRRKAFQRLHGSERGEEEGCV